MDFLSSWNVTRLKWIILGPSLQTTRKATCKWTSWAEILTCRWEFFWRLASWTQKSNTTCYTTQHTPRLSTDFLAFCVIVARAAPTVNGLPIVQRVQSCQQFIYWQSQSQLMADGMTHNFQQQWNATCSVHVPVVFKLRKWCKSKTASWREMQTCTSFFYLLIFLLRQNGDSKEASS